MTGKFNGYEIAGFVDPPRAQSAIRRERNLGETKRRIGQEKHSKQPHGVCANDFALCNCITVQPCQSLGDAPVPRQVG